MADLHPRSRDHLLLGALIGIHIVAWCVSLIYVAAYKIPIDFDPSSFHVFYDPSRLHIAVFLVLAFSVLVLGYDTIWGVGGRPQWIVTSRSYPFVNSASEMLVKMIGERRRAAAEAAAQDAIKRKATDSLIGQ